MAQSDHLDALRILEEIEILLVHPAISDSDLAEKVQPIKDLKDRLAPLIRIDESKWRRQDEKTRGETLKQLTQAKATLYSLLKPDGPVESGHWMSKCYASNFAIGMVAAYATLVLVVSMVLIYRNWNEATKSDGWIENQKYMASTQALSVAVEDTVTTRESLRQVQEKLDKLLTPAVPADGPKPEDEQSDNELESLTKQKDDLKVALLRAETRTKDASKNAQVATSKLNQALAKGVPDEATVLLVVILMGIAGGSLRMVGSLVQYVGYRKLSRSWLLYYFVMPSQGAVLAPFIYLLLRVGVLSPSVGSQSGTAQINLVSMYVFAGLTGLFAKEATDKLSEVFKTIFRSAHEPKESLRSVKR